MCGRTVLGDDYWALNVEPITKSDGHGRIFECSPEAWWRLPCVLVEATVNSRKGEVVNI